MRALNPLEVQVLQALSAAHQTGTAADVSALTDNLEVLVILQHMAAREGWRMGQAPSFWKSGGPSPAQPLFHAPLPPAGAFLQSSPEQPAQITAPACTLHGVEAEIALRLGRSIDRQQALSLTADSVHSVIDGMTVAIEWVDSRWQQNLAAPLRLLQADRLSHGALVLGENWLPYSRRDWSAQRCSVQIDQQTPLVFTGSHPLGDPSAVLLPWLLHATECWGEVPAGTIVTTGSWTGIVQAPAGSQISISFEGLTQAWMNFPANPA